MGGEEPPSLKLFKVGIKFERTSLVNVGFEDLLPDTILSARMVHEHAFFKYALNPCGLRKESH